MSPRNEQLVVCPKLASGNPEPERELTVEEQITEFPFTILGRVMKRNETDDLLWKEAEKHEYYVVQVLDFYQLSSNMSFLLFPERAKVKLDRMVPLHDRNTATARRTIFFLPITKACTQIEGFVGSTMYTLPHFKADPAGTEKLKKFKCGVAFRHDTSSCPHKLKRRCHRCGARAHLALGTDCQCGFVFCGKHKFAKEKLGKNEDDAHECDFDFKSRAKEQQKKRISADGGGGYANNGIPRGGEGI